MNHYMKQINKPNGTKVGILTIHSIKIYVILFPKLFLPTCKKKLFCGQEKTLKFEAKGREFEKILRHQ